PFCQPRRIIAPIVVERILLESDLIRDGFYLLLSGFEKTMKFCLIAMNFLNEFTELRLIISGGMRNIANVELGPRLEWNERGSRGRAIRVCLDIIVDDHFLAQGEEAVIPKFQHEFYPGIRALRILGDQ